MHKIPVATWSELADRAPAHALVENIDLVIIRYDQAVSVFYGRCPHRGALLGDGRVVGHNLICGVHDWDFRYDSGVSEYNNEEALKKFAAWIEDDRVLVDGDELAAWYADNPQPYDREAYQGAYADIHGTPEEPHVGLIRQLAAGGLESVGHHGPVGAMGVARQNLPGWDDIQILTAQLATLPLLDDAPVASEVVIGPAARKPLRLEIPLFVADMSFGALSEEAKVALARGAEAAGTAICSGEGGMLPEEKAENSRYFYELASARFGFSMDQLAECQAFHFKGGQAAKTGTGGHLPGNKVSAKIAQVRGLEVGQAAVSPARFPEWTDLAEMRDFAGQVRQATGGIPIGYKMSAQHLEADMDAAFELGVDYIILDGRGGGTGAAPLIFRDNISLPTIPALARARRHLTASGKQDVTLVITGGLRTPADFAKALALGADAVAIGNSALQAIGCLGMRACHTNNCPVGIATQKPHLRARLVVHEAAARLARFLRAATDLMKVLARACGHHHLNKFSPQDLVTWKRDMADLAGIPFAGDKP